MNLRQWVVSRPAILSQYCKNNIVKNNIDSIFRQYCMNIVEILQNFPYCLNIGSILQQYCAILLQYCTNIFFFLLYLLRKYWPNIAQYWHHYCHNIVPILLQYPNIATILLQYWANINSIKQYCFFLLFKYCLKSNTFLLGQYCTNIVTIL